MTTKNKRATCDDCRYPVKTCMCDYLVTIKNKTKVILIQHPKEIKHAKNTGRLLTLCCENIECFVGESESDLSELKQQVLQTSSTQLLFPASEEYTEYTDPKSLNQECSNQKSLDQHRPNQTYSIQKPEQQATALIIIDATWRKATKIIALNPWLLELPRLTINEQTQQYRIRKTSIDNGLSTIEAAAYALETVESIPADSLLNVLDRFAGQFTKHMPKDVKTRY